MEYISFLASLSPEAFALIQSIYHQYANCDLKGQKAKHGLQKPSCSPSKFRCLRGDLQESEVSSLLSKVEEGKYSVQEMEIEARRTKKFREVQRMFVSETASKDWEEAVER